MDQEGPFAPFALAPPPPPSATVQLTGAKESSKSTCIPYKIEYGTGIRECKGPQPCNGSLIEQGVLQFSTFWLDCPWGPRWVYRHWSCMTPTVFKNLHDKIGDNVEDLHGFSHLSSSDQAHVRQAFDAGTPTGISRLTAAEIKSLLGQAGLKKSGDKGMITDRCTGFFNAAGLSLEGTLDDLRDRIDGYAALGAKGMLPTPGEGSSTGAMQSETIVDSHQPDVKMEIGGSAAMMDVEVDEKKPQLNSDTEDEELEDKKPHLKSDSEEDENFGKPSKKRKRATKKAAKPRVKKEPIKKKINVKPLAPTPASSVQPTRRSRRFNGSQLDEIKADPDAPGPSSSSLPVPSLDANEIFPAKMEDEEQDGLVPLGGVEQEAAHEELEENVAPKVEEDQGLISVEAAAEEADAGAQE